MELAYSNRIRPPSRGIPQLHSIALEKNNEGSEEEEMMGEIKRRVSSVGQLDFSVRSLSVG